MVELIHPPIHAGRIGEAVLGGANRTGAEEVPAEFVGQ